MALIASIIAYLATATGISVGFLLIIGALLAPPAPAVRPHDAGTRSTQSAPPLHTVAATSRAKVGGRPRLASFKRADERKPWSLRQKPHLPVAREEGNDWAYRAQPGFSRRASYAQDFSENFTFYR